MYRLTDKPYRDLPVIECSSFLECRRVADYKSAIMLQFHVTHLNRHLSSMKEKIKSRPFQKFNSCHSFFEQHNEHYGSIIGFYFNRVQSFNWIRCRSWLWIDGIRASVTTAGPHQDDESGWRATTVKQSVHACSLVSSPMTFYFQINS